MSDEIGEKIKSLRTAKGWTLKELSSKSGLSTGYLSLVERNLTSINITSLQSIAAAFDKNINTFFTPPEPPTSYVIRSHEQKWFSWEGSNIYFSLSGNLPQGAGTLEPVVVQVKPERDGYTVQEVCHSGEEFGYVLEGIITAFIDGKQFELYPGDSYHILSEIPHQMVNLSNRLAKILLVNTPKFFQEQKHIQMQHEE